VDQARQSAVFITEMMASGTLKQYIHQAKGVKLKTIKKWCLQILSGLAYLHGHNPPIIHRDLKVWRPGGFASFIISHSVSVRKHLY
jgi:serine/threonine protein kinase